MKKVLIVTYYWPPAGGPGVQRILKFAKYLPEMGWEPIILTVSKGAYTALDPSLENDIPPGLKVFRSTCPEPDTVYKIFSGTKTDSAIPVGVLATKNLNWKKRLAHTIRLNYFIPDAKKYWRSFGVRTGKKIIKDLNPDLIFSSSPPPTTHLIAHDLAKASGLPWVADFRDPWTKIHYYGENRSKRAQEKDLKLERLVLQNCTQATCVSEHFAKLLECDDPVKIKIVHNGFDAEDFDNHPPKSEKFKITYIGGLNSNRFYRSFFEHVRDLFEQNKIPAKNVEIGFAGQIEPNIKDEISKLFSKFKVLRFYDYLDHPRAVYLMQESHLLLLFLEDKANYQGHLPGKLFEYLAAGTPVLGVGLPDGEAARILKDARLGEIMDKKSNPSKFVVQAYQDFINGNKNDPDQKIINKFERWQLTQKLAGIFDALV